MDLSKNHVQERIHVGKDYIRMLVGRLTYDTKQRHKSTGESSPNRVPSEFLSSKNLINERPLKSNLNDLSFKGLSFNGENKENKPAKKDDKLKPLMAMFGTLAAIGLVLRLAPAYKKAGTYNLKEFENFSKQYLGIVKTGKNGEKIKTSMGEDLFNHLKKSPLTNKMMKVVKDPKTGEELVEFHKKTIPQLIWDGLIYPFKILPADILNGGVELIGRIKPFKGWAKKVHDRSMFQQIRQRSKIDAEVNSLRGLFETADKLKGKSESEISSTVFQRSVKMFDPKTGNYDTKHERSLNRLVSGLPPAIFLANDAYNLSRMMDDNGKEATHEQQVRFKQEMARIGFNAYITLVTLGALQKYINNSKMGIMLMTALTTLTTEAFSRVINGKHITRLTPEQARKENTKNHTPEASIKPETSFKAAEKPKDDKQQKPLLSFKSVLKGALVIVAGGYAVKGLRKIPQLDNTWKSFAKQFTNAYKDLTQIKDYKISSDKFDKITKILEDNGFESLADKYRKVAQTAENGDKTISLGAKDKKIKPLVDFVIAPFKFIWKYGTLPYKFVDDAVSSIGKKAAKSTSKKVEDISALSKSIDNIGKQAENLAKKKITPKQFQDYVKDNILKAFNIDSMSNVSNSELSNLAKTAALAATIWFLMTDNYNMVMLKSNGNDVEGAKTKFTERFVQEGSRLFYQTLLIDLFNSTFRSQYNKSLFGMSWITLSNTTLGEWLTRKSVGVPVGTHTRDQLIELENKQNNATGFERKYYDFMKRLTGKRSIKTYEIDKKEHPAEHPAAKESETKSANVNFSSKQVFKQMMKG